LRESDGPKVALVVVDGMAQDQWILIRRELARQRPTWRFDEGPRSPGFQRSHVYRGSRSSRARPHSTSPRASTVPAKKRPCGSSFGPTTACRFRKSPT
jgi:hypothetical protein